MLGIVKEAAESHIRGKGKDIVEDSTIYVDMVIVYHYHHGEVVLSMGGARKKNLPTCTWTNDIIRSQALLYVWWII